MMKIKIDKEILLGHLKRWLFLIIITFISLQIIFYKESPIVTLRYLFSLLYLYTLPGFFIVDLLAKKLKFTEKIVVGTGFGFGMTSVLAYYAGILGLGFFVQVILIPLLIIAASLFLRFKIFKDN